jgi:hypothetical protein
MEVLCLQLEANGVPSCLTPCKEYSLRLGVLARDLFWVAGVARLGVKMRRDMAVVVGGRAKKTLAACRTTMFVGFF